MNITRVKRNAAICILLCIVGLLLWSCKPTEKNYLKAYEAAQRRRQQEVENSDIDLSRMIRIDTPQRKYVGGDSAYVRHEALNLYGRAPQSGQQPCNLAVAKYNMRANAEAHAENLRADGYDAFIYSTPAGEFYVMAGAYSDLSTAIRARREYITRHPDAPYIGLPGEPVIEIPLGSRL